MSTAFPIHKNEQGERVRVGVIVWVLDPEGNVRYFLRHNKPFNGYRDEWNMIFGSVEPDENIHEAVIREVKEESNLTVTDASVHDLEYSLRYTAANGPTVIHFFGVKALSIDERVTLNEESIGYDWAVLEEVQRHVPYQEQVKAFELLAKTIR